MLISTALVLLMTPALGFFYGGLVRAKNVLNTLMMSVACLGVVGITWAVLGYSLAFSKGTPFIGGLDYMFLRGVDLEPGPWGGFPHLLFMCFQGTFAIITAALVSGAVVERMRFGSYLVFASAWTLAVYAPIAHWVWGGGFLAQLGALDFAGGTVVHINAGIAAIVASLMIGARKDYGRQAFLPHNVPFVLLGAGLLWFGWFGFNGGSALGANRSAALAFANTMLAPAATLVVWMLLDLVRSKRATAVGAATGAVVGLVAITPAAGYISPTNAMLLGAFAAFPSYFVIQWRSRSRMDDSLDVFAAHGTGGIVGAILTGVLASKVWGAPAGGLVDGESGLIISNLAAILAAAAYSALGTFVLLKLIGMVEPLHRSRANQGLGMDVVQHGEEGYSHGEGAILVLPGKRKPASEREPTTVDSALPTRVGAAV